MSSDVVPDLVDVCIVGAGLAGLTAAERLRDAGFSCVVIEGSDRIGGRLRSTTFAGRHIEDGANWVHGVEGNPIWKRIQELGLQGEFDEEEEKAVVRLNGRDATEEAAARFAAFDEAMEAVEGKELPAGEDTDMATALAQEGWTVAGDLDAAVEYYRCDFEYGEVPELTSVFHNVHEEFSTEDFDEQLFAVDDPRGYVSLCSVPEGVPVLFDERVVRIDHAHDRPAQVHCLSGRQISARAVLCTVSVGVLKSGGIAFLPALSEGKQEAIDSMSMCNYTKIYAEFADAFWGDARYILHAGAERRQYVVWRPLAGSKLVEVTVTGDEGRRVEGLSKRDLRAELTAALREMYSGGDVPPPEPKDVHVFGWSSSPLFQGAYSFLPTGALPKGFGPLLAPEGSLFFAGEAFHARYSGYLHGAYVSGEDAAEQISDFLGRR
eukprot:TRINITY_DN10569_c0_g1_i1.p1 TRINITY_DN10569_c0_g1~~TRINITY_DN10569_c0_g1_i1.p1  ORF type:complete len:451 (+),score=74.12 TRINITY_DN10569_c0_g1_i1:51-1355(+)